MSRYLRYLRYLRILWTALCAIACLLLIVLWVRSYHRRDILGGTIWSHVLAIESADGNVACSLYFLNPAFSKSPWRLESYDPKSAGFGTRINGRYLLKDWSLLLLFAFLAAVPWVNLIKWDPKPRR